MSKGYLYMLSSNDEFELPIMVTDRMQEIADYIGTTKAVCFSNLSKHCKAIGVGYRYRLERIDLEENDCAYEKE